MTGLKDRQRLALYVALGLSAGSGLTLDASTAYAAEPVNIAASDTAHASGINATKTTRSASDNKLTVGETSPAVPNTPVINGDVIGGYSDAYAVTHNTVTVESMAFELAHSVFGGLANGDTVSDNVVTVNGGDYASGSSLYGGKTTGKGAATGNSVTVTGGDFGTGLNIYGGVAEGTATLGNAAEHNTVTITGGAFAGGNIYGGDTTDMGTTVTRSHDNTVVLGSESGVYTADLSNVNILGAKDARTGNTLVVNASNVRLITLQPMSSI